MIFLKQWCLTCFASRELIYDDWVGCTAAEFSGSFSTRNVTIQKTFDTINYRKPSINSIDDVDVDVDVDDDDVVDVVVDDDEDDYNVKMG